MKNYYILATVLLKIWLYPNVAMALDCELAENSMTRIAVAQRLEARALLETLREESKSFDKNLIKAFCASIIENINDKEKSIRLGASFSESELKKQIIEYEKFRLISYLSSGVSTKRYFGFFDLKGDSAKWEKILRDVLIQAVPIVNAYAEESGLKVRITEKEVAVTFISEGGALLLSNRISKVNRVHPVIGVGLDNYRSGFKRHSKLVMDLDRQFQTKLSGLLLNILGYKVLLRPMTFREAILGTAIMYLYEKEITHDKYLKDTGLELSRLSLDRQFIHSSLVYNSEILFSDERVEQILNFATEDYLHLANLKNSTTRPVLPLYSVQERANRLIAGGQIPQQLTSWSAVYHILQRYGAWVALQRFSDVFDQQGSFLKYASK